MNPLLRLARLGQSVYLDEISRDLVRGGGLRRLIDEDGLRGVTSNPAIFEKAIAHSKDYDDTIADLARSGLPVVEIYEALAVQDVQEAADLFADGHRASGGDDGYVSLEVSPLLADDTEGTMEEARRLWQRLARPNVFIKVPGTEAGIAAIRQLSYEGINLNVTLLFGLPRYRQVAEAYLAGLEQRRQEGLPLDGIASVASFFLSRIDVAIDPQLDRLAEQGGEQAELARSLRGQVAIASAKGAWQVYQELFGPGAAAFEPLAKAGARPQWLLWASTGTKDPSYPDTHYVEPLIGATTVTTLPRETLDAYRDHGRPALRLDEGLAEAAAQLAALASLGIDLDQVTEQLEREGVEKFVKPFEALLGALERSVAAVGA